MDIIAQSSRLPKNLNTQSVQYPARERSSRGVRRKCLKDLPPRLVTIGPHIDKQAVLSTPLEYDNGTTALQACLLVNCLRNVVSGNLSWRKYRVRRRLRVHSSHVEGTVDEPVELGNGYA